MTNPLDILKNFREIPAMPNVMVQALNIIKDPDSGTNDLAKIISYDQALSIKILTLVNSAYYGFSQQITSISRAVSLLGMAKTKNIIVTIAMRPMLTSQGDKTLWKHLITTAVGCEYIAKYLKVMDVDEAFVIGFLHDLGKVILKKHDPARYEHVNLMVGKGYDRIMAEKQYFGIDHCIIGSLLANQWQLPLLINNVIKYHHRPLSSAVPGPCALVCFVDSLSKDNFSLDKLEPNILAIINIKPQDVMALKTTIMSKAEVLIRELSN